MKKIIEVIKNGNRITGYKVLSEGCKQPAIMSKREIYQIVRSKEPINATAQIYKGRIVIRVKESAKIEKKPELSKEEKRKRDAIKIQAIMGKATVIDTEFPGQHIYMTQRGSDAVIYIPENVRTIGGAAPNAWQKITGTIKVIGGEGVQNANGMFRMAQANKIDISEFDTSNIKVADSMFGNLFKVTEIDLSKNRFDKLERAQFMFVRSNELKRVITKNVDFTLLMDMQGWFYECRKIETANINISGYHAIDMTCLFIGCEKLHKVSIQAPNVTTIVTESMFTRCKRMFDNDSKLEINTDSKVLDASIYDALESAKSRYKGR